jgi:hypothetical protein
MESNVGDKPASFLRSSVLKRNWLTMRRTFIFGCSQLPDCPPMVMLDPTTQLLPLALRGIAPSSVIVPPHVMVSEELAERSAACAQTKPVRIALCCAGT